MKIIIVGAKEASNPLAKMLGGNVAGRIFGQTGPGEVIAWLHTAKWGETDVLVILCDIFHDLQAALRSFRADFIGIILLITPREGNLKKQELLEWGATEWIVDLGYLHKSQEIVQAIQTLVARGGKGESSSSPLALHQTVLPQVLIQPLPVHLVKSLPTTRLKERKTVMVAGKEITLPEKTAWVLERLLEEPEAIVSGSILLNGSWDREMLIFRISEIRGALDVAFNKGGRTALKTSRWAGYSISLAELEARASSPPEKY